MQNLSATNEVILSRPGRKEVSHRGKVTLHPLTSYI